MAIFRYEASRDFVTGQQDLNRFFNDLFPRRLSSEGSDAFTR